MDMNLVIRWFDSTISYFSKEEINNMGIIFNRKDTTVPFMDVNNGDYFVVHKCTTTISKNKARD